MTILNPKPTDWSKEEIIDTLTKIAKERHHLSYKQFLKAICRTQTWCGCKDYRELLEIAGIKLK
jgi:hypothetical protein